MEKKFFCGHCRCNKNIEINYGVNLIEFRCQRCGMFNKIRYVYTEKKIVNDYFIKRSKELKKLRKQQQKLYNKLLKQFKTG